MAGALLVLCDAPRLSAMGSPPLMTDDTGTAGDRHREFNFGFSTERRPGSRVS